MGFSRITETTEWKGIQAKLEQMKQETALKEQAENRIKEFTEPFGYHELNENNMDFDYKRVSKAEFHRLAKQLTEWEVWNSGSVIKREGPLNVKRAVELTLACINRIKNPGAYFRKVLKNLQKSQ